MKKKQTKKDQATEPAKIKRTASEKTYSSDARPVAPVMKAGKAPVPERSAAKGRASAGPAGGAPADRPAAEKMASEKKDIKKESVLGQKKRVTFRLPAQAAPAARKVTIVGEFNGWDQDANPLRRLENGDFAVTIELESGKEYRFRYLIDGTRWENDWRADKYVKSPYGADDSVIAL